MASSENSAMYEYQMQLETKRKARMYNLAMQEYMIEAKSMKQAKASHASNRILSKRNRKGSIHNRLYESGVKKQNSQTKNYLDMSNQQYDFKPKINTVSVNLPRDGRIEDRLINEAKRLENKKKTMKRSSQMVKNIESYGNMKNNKSTNIIFKNFTKEYENVLFDMNKDKGDSFTNDELTMILYKLGFITQVSMADSKDNSSNDIWIILGGETQEQIMEASVFNIMCIMQNLDYPFLYSKKYLTPSKNNVV